jgi:PAS domain S-box-containing protein
MFQDEGVNAPMSDEGYRDAHRKLELAEFMAGVGHWEFDLRTRKVTWSDEVYRIYGVTRETFDPNLDSAVGGYHPDDQPTLLRMIARAEQTGEGYDLKLRILRVFDGAERTVMAKAVVRRNAAGHPEALFGVFRDITEREVAARRLEASEAYHRLLTENSTDVIARYGEDGKFTYLSPAVENILGYSPGDLIGRTTFSIIDPDDCDRVAAEFRAYVQTGPGAASVRIEYRAFHRDGSVRWLEAHPRGCCHLWMAPAPQGVI